MQVDFVYGLTPQGEKELQGGETTLSVAEVELIVRVDGVLTYGQIKASMPNMTPETFKGIIGSLVARKLLKVIEVDPFAAEFKVQIDNKSLSLMSLEADAGSVALNKSGYYVSIACKRGVARVLANGEALTAIVVDDEPLLAKFVETFLTLDGFKVRVAGNRAEVIAELRKTPIPDLILLDVMLPDVDGVDILLRIRQHPALKKVPVILLTGKAKREDVIKGLAAGADGYVTKPFEVDVLMRAVRTVVGLPVGQNDKNKSNASTDPWVNQDTL